MITASSQQRVLIEHRNAAGFVVKQSWLLPVAAGWLSNFLEDIFSRYWDRITYGPILGGIAYEWTCPCAPDRIHLSDGYLTIGFGGPHFHLCVGPGAVPDTWEGRQLMPGEASLFRSLDETGAPNSWGFELRNGADNPVMSIYFDNPFLTGPDCLADTPDWSRLSMWRDIAARYAGLPHDPLDEAGKGFGWAAAA